MGVENGQQLLARRSGLALDIAHQPSAELFVAPPQNRLDELLLRAEMFVQRHLCDAGLGQDPVDTGGIEAVSVKQIYRRVNAMSLTLPSDDMIT